MQTPKRVRPPHYAPKRRSLSLRATSFVESIPGRSEFKTPRVKSAPKPKPAPKPSKREQRLLDRMLASGDVFLQLIAARD